MVQQEELACGGPLGPFDWRRILPFEPAAASDRLGWVGLEAARYSAEPADEVHPPALLRGGSCVALAPTG